MWGKSQPQKERKKENKLHERPCTYLWSMSLNIYKSQLAPIWLIVKFSNPLVYNAAWPVSRKTGSYCELVSAYAISVAYICVYVVGTQHYHNITKIPRGRPEGHSAKKMWALLIYEWLNHKFIFPFYQCSRVWKQSIPKQWCKMTKPKLGQYGDMMPFLSFHKLTKKSEIRTSKPLSEVVVMNECFFGPCISHLSGNHFWKKWKSFIMDSGYRTTRLCESAGLLM